MISTSAQKTDRVALGSGNKGAHHSVPREPFSESRSSILCRCTRLILTTIPCRLRYLFGFLTLTFVAISIAFNVAFVANLTIDGNVLHKMKPARSKTIAIYICNDLYNKMHIRKVQELQSYFGQDLIVVTDEQDIQDDWILPAEQIISPDSNITLTTKLALSPPPICCGMERSIMWLILNQDNYDYAWIMEDDVLWSNFTDFKDFFQSTSHDDADLLHSNLGMEEHSFYDVSRWWAYSMLLPPHVSTQQAKFHTPFHEGYFPFYRLSSRFVVALNDWRLKNNGEWTFYESLFANLAFRNDTTTKNLTTKNFINNSIGYDFQIERHPCYSLEQVYNKTNINGGRGGLFHPVEKDAMSTNCRIQPTFFLQQPHPTTGVDNTNMKNRSNGDIPGTFDSEQTGTRSQPKTNDDQPKTNEGQSPPSSNSCWRKCDHYHNKIILYPSVLQYAGLSDRATRFVSLLNIAGYLCARAFVPAPENSLHPGHTRGDPSIENTSWPDFMDLRMLSSNRSDSLVTLPTTFKRADTIEAMFPIMDTSDNDWMYITTTNPTHIIHDFEQVEEVSWKSNNYFVWGMNTSGLEFWDFSNILRDYLQTRMLLRNSDSTASDNVTDATKQVASTIHSTMLPQVIHMSEGCVYSAVYPPAHVQASTDWVWDRVQNQLDVLTNNSISNDSDVLVGYLHIRRRDGVYECNTPLERMEAFLRCSFQHIEQNRTALLFSSDEKDPSYRHAIQSFVEHYAGQFFDLDQMALDAVRHDIAQVGAAAAYRKNNYYIYHVIRSVAQRTAFQLVQRRDINCPDCVEMSINDLPRHETRLEYYLTPLVPLR